MQIIIDTTEEISDLEQQMLLLFLTGKVTPVPDLEPAKAEPKAEPPAKKAAAKKAAAKPDPEPEPEPMAEEPLEDEPESEDEGIDDETSDEDLLAMAVKKATEMVAGGEAAQVRDALDAAGANRVRELNADNVREFFKALG